MRLSSALIPMAGSIVFSAAVPASLSGTPETRALVEERAPAPDLGDFMNDLPALISDIVTTSLSIARALKQAVKDEALVRNDLDAVLGNDAATSTTAAPGAQETPSPNDDNANENGDENSIEARQDDGGGDGDQATIPGSAPCPDIAVLYAKGAKEPGNVGFLAGPPFFAALDTYFNGSTSSVAVQGISYRASLLSAASSDGSFRMVDLARRTAEACPDIRITMAGYSRGAVVVRSALEQMGAEGASPVSSVVLFGDPQDGNPVPAVDAGRVVSFCHEGDVVCKGRGGQQIGDGAGGDNDLVSGNDNDDDDTQSRKGSVGAHLDYAMDAPAAAMFVMQRSGLGMASDDAMNDGMDGTLAGMVQEIARNGVDGING